MVVVFVLLFCLQAGQIQRLLRNHNTSGFLSPMASLHRVIPILFVCVFYVLKVSSFLLDRPGRHPPRSKSEQIQWQTPPRRISLQNSLWDCKNRHCNNRSVTLLLSSPTTPPPPLSTVISLLSPLDPCPNDDDEHSQLTKLIIEVNDIIHNFPSVDASDVGSSVASSLHLKLLKTYRKSLLALMMRKSYLSYIRLATFLSTTIERWELPNVQDIPYPNYEEWSTGGAEIMEMVEDEVSREGE